MTNSMTASNGTVPSSCRDRIEAVECRRRDLLMVGMLSLALHAWLYVTLQRPRVAESRPRPMPIEIQLIAPPAPVTLAPEPPPPPPPPLTRQEPSPPKSAPEPVLKRAPKPRPTPRPPAPHAPPAPTPPPAPVAVAPAAVAPSVPAAAPVLNSSPIAPAPAPEPPVTPAHTRATSSHNPKPVYPSLARRRGWEGKVLLNIEVLFNGLPGAVDVAQTSGHAVLDEAAVRTVRQWTFTPAMRGATAIDSRMTLSVVFKLDN